MAKPAGKKKAKAGDGRRVAYRNLLPGDPAPRFRQRTPGNPDYVFDSAAGRYLVLGFVGTTGDAAGAGALAFLRERRDLFDDERVAFFGVTVDPADEARVKNDLPGIRWFLDFDAAASRLYGAAPVDPSGGAVPVRRLWVVVDPTLRVVAVLPLTQDGADRAALAALLDGLPPVDRFAGIEVQAPVLYLPRVFEPDLCRRLIAAYEAGGGESSGFMAERDGRTVLLSDPAHKRRRDVILSDPALIAATRERVRRRIVPEIRGAHQFEATRMERYLVACYDAAEAGHFRAHRDNTTSGTAHRRFAVSINLSEDFEGGEIGFPEYGSRTFKPPVGCAVVFSCSLLHRVTPVTRGRRYAFLPFLYDEAAAQVREANASKLADGLGGYRA